MKKLRRKALKIVKDWHIIYTGESIEEIHKKICNILNSIERRQEEGRK